MRRAEGEREHERGTREGEGRGREAEAGKNHPSTTVFKILPIKLTEGKKKKREQCGSLREGLIEQVVKSAQKTSHVSIRSLNQHSGKKTVFPNILMTAGSKPPILDSNKYRYLGRKIGSDLTVPLKYAK